VLHPDLAGDGAAQLTTIAQCSRAWRAIPLDIPVSASSLTLTARRPGRAHVGLRGRTPVRAGVIVGTFVYGAWTVTVAFMGAAGWSLAHASPEIKRAGTM